MRSAAVQYFRYQRPTGKRLVYDIECSPRGYRVLLGGRLLIHRIILYAVSPIDLVETMLIYAKTEINALVGMKEE